MKKSGNYHITKISVNSHEQVDYLEINHEEVPVADGKIEKNKVATIGTVTGEVEPSSGYGAMDKVTYSVDTAPKIAKQTPSETAVDYKDTAPVLIEFADIQDFTNWAIIDVTEGAILDSDAIGTDLTVTFADITAATDTIKVAWGYPSSADTAEEILAAAYYVAEIENPKPEA
jgi:hypothetical protein